MSPVEPPRWSDEQLDANRMGSIALFRKERLEEPLERYLETFDKYRGDVEDLLEATVDLARLTSPDLDVLTDPALLVALRYLAGPPISEDDLKVLAEASLAPSKLKADREMATRVIETILVALDRGRFPWISEEREPEPAEREAAAMASAALMASQRFSTDRRSEGKDAQEEAVATALRGWDFQQVPARVVKTLDEAPATGEFCRESQLGKKKADFIVGLWDGRKLAIECKVSNSSLNSIKRLNDVTSKATLWLSEFGTAQLVPAGVIGGVFNLSHLKAAQSEGLTIFWAHNLDAMLDWIESTHPCLADTSLSQGRER